jgi:UDP-N-acetylglucosamine/UDP-N-acetylgalactosamine diphosphorylase
MIKVTSESDRVCVAKVHEAGQLHVFDTWEDLSSEEQRALIAQLRDMDFQLLKRLVQAYLHGEEELERERVLRPAPTIPAPASEAEREEHGLCQTLGEYALRKEEVAIVMAAGSGGLGPFCEPVGMLPVGPVSGKSLFQLQAEKIMALNRRYRISLRWFMFCHPEVLPQIAAYFKNRDHFGLNPSDVVLLEEETLPFVDRRGKLLLSAPGKIALGTVGQGGILLQLLEEERLRVFERANVKHVFFCQADNPLVRIADPVFLGFHIKNQSEVSAKAIHKVDPEEDLALFCRLNGAVGVVRAAELPAEERASRHTDGGLVFGAAHIGILVFSLDFLRRLQRESVQLPFRGVPHAIPCVGKRGQAVRPTEPNSIRFQAFIFDVVRRARSTSILEVRREDEFSPIKNTSGPSSPLTAQRDLSSLYTRWLREAAGSADALSSVGPDSGVEISPLYALDAEELKRKIELPLEVTKGGILLGSTT